MSEAPSVRASIPGFAQVVLMGWFLQPLRRVCSPGPAPPPSICSCTQGCRQPRPVPSTWQAFPLRDPLEPTRPSPPPLFPASVDGVSSHPGSGARIRIIQHTVIPHPPATPTGNWSSTPMGSTRRFPSTRSAPPQALWQRPGARPGSHGFPRPLCLPSSRSHSAPVLKPGGYQGLPQPSILPWLPMALQLKC